VIAEQVQETGRKEIFGDKHASTFDGISRSFGCSTVSCTESTPSFELKQQRRALHAACEACCFTVSFQIDTAL
jgi:hypothetical protein